jgi:hypothetical protein
LRANADSDGMDEDGCWIAGKQNRVQERMQPYLCVMSVIYKKYPVMSVTYKNYTVHT